VAVPDPKIENPADAIVRITHGCICGSDLWPYQSQQASEQGQRIGHELIGIVDGTGAGVERIKPGDLVVAPFYVGDGTCEYCRAGLTTACPNGGVIGGFTDGGQGEAARIHYADAALMRLMVPHDSALMPSLLTLSASSAPGTTPPSRPGSGRARTSSSSATAPWVCSRYLPRSASAPTASC
jgi:threonine dehydrogenase-like Zn-dependent dehydrogenase